MSKPGLLCGISSRLASQRALGGHDRGHGTAVHLGGVLGVGGDWLVASACQALEQAEGYDERSAGDDGRKRTQRLVGVERRQALRQTALQVTRAALGGLGPDLELAAS